MTRMTVWRTSRLAWKANRSGVGSLFFRLRLVWQAQIGAQHINAGLPVRPPVVAQTCHGVHTG